MRLSIGFHLCLWGLLCAAVISAAPRSHEVYLRTADGEYVRSADGRLITIDRSLLESIYNTVITNPYQDLAATVRVGGGLCDAEKTFVEKRRVVCHSAVEQCIGKSIAPEHTPTIMVMGSGGGIRASLWMLGGLRGLKDIGVLPATTYVGGLSGSTWPLATWMLSAHAFDLFHDEMLDRISHSFLQHSVQEQVETLQKMLPLVTEMFLRMIIFEGTSLPSPAIVMYGLMLGTAYLGVDSAELLYRDLAQMGISINSGQEPLPLFTFVVPVRNKKTEPLGDDQLADVGPDAEEIDIVDEDLSEAIKAGKLSYMAAECSPYEVSYLDYKDFATAAIPVWSAGSPFAGGTVSKINPAMPCCLWMGIWGSAISATFQEVYTTFLKDAQPQALFSALEKLVTAVFGDARMFTYKARNFTKDMEQVASPKATRHAYVDGGFETCIPVWIARPERAADVIVVLDASGDVAKGVDLRKAEDYARRHNLPFPTIDYEKALSQTLTVFDDGAGKPIVIYIPLMKNSNYDAQFNPWDYMDVTGFLNTFNFIYTPENAKLVDGLATYTIHESAQIIKDAIATAVERKEQVA